MAATNLREFTLGVRRHVEETRERHQQRTRAVALYGLHRPE